MTRSDVPSSTPLQGFDELAMVRRTGMRGWLRRHPQVMNLIIVGIYVAAALYSFPLALLDTRSDAWWLIPGYVVITALLFFRHVRPVAVLVVIALAEATLVMIYPWHGSTMMGLWFAAYCVGLHKGLVWGLATSVPVTLVGYAGFLRIDEWMDRYGEGFWVRQVYQISAAEVPGVLLVMVITGVVISGVSAAIGASVRRSHAHEREILEWARQSHQLAQVGERNRIAREMHDVVAHSLSVMISLADGARVVVRRDADRASEVLEELASTGRSALGDMRRVIGVLKKGEEVAEARRPIHESLEELYAGFRQAGLPLEVSVSGPPLPEDAAFGLTVHRILQESLTNVLRYGTQVSSVTVDIAHTPATTEDEKEELISRGFSEKEQRALGLAAEATVVITVSDDGLLMPAEQRKSMGSGLGITGMQERAEFYHGSVYAGPGKHRGWMVRAVLQPPVQSSSVQKRQGDDS